MRALLYFSILCVVFFTTLCVTNNELIATVNAAIVKRTVSAPVELCINDIIKVNKQLKLLKKAADSFTKEQANKGFLPIHTNITTADTLLQKSVVDCNSSSTTSFSNAESRAINQIISDYSGNTTAALTSIAKKKVEIFDLFLMGGLMGADIQGLYDHTGNLSKALTSKTKKPEFLSVLTDHFKQLNSTFQTAKIAFPYPD